MSAILLRAFALYLFVQAVKSQDAVFQFADNSPIRAVEGATAVLSIITSSTFSSSVTVTIRRVGGNAVNQDFSSGSDSFTATFKPFDTQQDINIGLSSSVAIDGSKDAMFAISESNFYTIGTRNEMKLIIEDGNSFQSIFFVSNSMPYNEWGDAVIVINTELSANTMDLTSEFTIKLVISDGTAEEGLDFSVDTRTVTLSPCSGSGCNTHIFESISIAPDRILEGSEMFNVSFDASSLSLPGAIRNFGQPTTIEIREIPPMVEFNQTTYQFAEGGDDMVCLVIRAIDSISDRVSITVTITLAGDSTILDAGSGDFGSGQVSHKFVFDSTSGPLVCESIEIVDDNNFEGTERFSATLSRTSSSAVELSTISAEITITDPSNDITQCSVVFTDQQYEVDPVSGDVTVEWAGTGPTADINVNEFTCNLPDGMSTDCTSPFVLTGLAQGDHTFSVIPRQISDPSLPQCSRGLIGQFIIIRL